MNLPPVVSPDEWQVARDNLLRKEKDATHALDALAAERRRLPMVRYDKEYHFEGPGGTVNLLDLFDERRQLIVYHFMNLGPDTYCRGCSSFIDNLGNLAHLRPRDITFAVTSTMPLAQITAFTQRMGWDMPFYSSRGSDFNADCGVTDGFGLSVFLRDGARIYRTYFTNGRGVDRLMTDSNLVDLTPYGRQEDWEDSPTGWPKMDGTNGDTVTTETMESALSDDDPFSGRLD